MSLHGSIAKTAFADARAVVETASTGLGWTRPAIDLRVGTHAAWASEISLGSPDLGPLHAAAHALRSGTTTAVALVEDALAVVAARDPELGAVVELLADSARAEARACDRDLADGRERGVLHGIPVTVKDVIDVAGVPTRAGSDAYYDVPAVDAAGVALLRGAGANVLAKVATHEFALGVTNPQSCNPHDPSRIPGGSSGGSAIAVATGMGLASLGTDTRASIRVPAALSGIVGFKPTYGRVPTDGVVTLSWTMDHVAPMARTVGDAALVMETLLGHGGLVAACGHGVDGLTVGVAEAGFADSEGPVADAVHAALAGLARAGARVVETPHPSARDLARANAAGMVISRCEATTFHADLGLDRTLYWDEVAEQLDAADDVRATEYLNAQRIRTKLVTDLSAAFDHVDLLAMPTSPVVAPPRDEFAEFLMLLARNAIPWSLVGFPAISVPVGAVDSLPVGLQLVAPPDREDLLVAAARAIERAVG